MANTFSALKRVRQEARRTIINRARKTRLRHQIRAFRRLVEGKDATAAQALLPRPSRSSTAPQVGHRQEEHRGPLQEPAHRQLEALGGLIPERDAAQVADRLEVNLEAIRGPQAGKRSPTQLGARLRGPAARPDPGCVGHAALRCGRDRCDRPGRRIRGSA